MPALLLVLVLMKHVVLGRADGHGGLSSFPNQFLVEMGVAQERAQAQRLERKAVRHPQVNLREEAGCVNGMR